MALESGTGLSAEVASSVVRFDDAASPWPGHLRLLVGADLMLRPSPRILEAIEAIHESIPRYEAAGDIRFRVLAQKLVNLLLELAQDMTLERVSDRFAPAVAELVTLLDQAVLAVLILARLEVAQGARGEPMIALREALRMRWQIAGIAGEIEAAKLSRIALPILRPLIDGQTARVRVARRVGDARVIDRAELCES